MEWLNLRQSFKEVLSYYNILDQVDVDAIAFSWSYDRNLATRFYKPSDVFKRFSFIHLLDLDEVCVCNTAKRFQHVRDPLTAHECSDFSKPTPHVCTMDLRIIQNPKLREALLQGLNHIPLSSTDTNQVLKIAVDAFARLYYILRSEDFSLDLHEASMLFKQNCLEKFRVASRTNKFGFKCSGPALFSTSRYL